jgi:DNA polymerase III subunit delta
VLYILWGEDEYSREEFIRDIKSKLGDISLLSTNTSVLDGADLSLNELKACAEVMPFLAEKRLVVIKGLLDRFEPKTGPVKAKKSPSSSARENEFQALIECLKNLPPSTILILSDKIENKKNPLQNNPLYRGIAEKAEVKPFPLLKGTRLSQWIQSRITQKGGAISVQATEILMQLIGGDLFTLSNEINKLVAFTAGRMIEEKDVRMVVSAAQEANIFVMVDALIDHKIDQAQNILQGLLKNGVAPGQILTLLARQIQMMVQIKDLKSQKRPTSEVISATGLNPYVLDKLVVRAEKYTLDNLKHIYNKLLETDLAIKTGKFDEDLALDILIADLGDIKGN